MWLPFGFRTTGLVEEWDLMWLHDRGEQLWWLTEDSALASLRLRPMFAALNELAYTLGDGFLWLNVIALVIFVCVGLATFMLVERLAPGCRAAALLAGSLAMLYPANAGLFTLRVIHIRAAAVLFLFALVLLCDLARTPRWWRFGLMSIVLAVSLLMYQIAAAALMVGPAAVLLAVGPANWRTVLKYSGLWFAAPVAVGCYWLFIAAQGGTYELSSANAVSRPSFGAYADDLVGAYLDQVLRAWRPASWVSWDTRYLIIGGLCGLLVALAVLTATGSSRLGSRASLVGSLTVIALSPLGFLPLWAIVYSIHETLKVYLLSSVAVAAGVALLLGFVCRGRVLFAVASGGLTALAVVYGLHQHAHYAALADAQTRVLGALVQQFPSPQDRTTIVVRDHSGQLSLVWTLGPPVTFSAAVQATYRNPTLAVVLCDEPTGTAHLDGKPIRTCPDDRTAPQAPAADPALDVAPERLAVFDYDPLREMRLVERRTGTLPAGYAPRRLTGRGRRSRGSLFPCTPIQECTQPPSASWPEGSIHETFGPEARNITGFRPSETAAEGLPFRWSITRTTHAYAYLPPRDAALGLRILYVVNPAVLESIRLGVNGRSVPIRVEPFGGGYRARAMIPGRALRPSPDDIEIRSDVVPVTGSPTPLGIAVARLDIEPESAGS
jgi:hypothetical protein